MDFIEALIIAFIVVILGVLGWVGYASITSGNAPTFELAKAEWVCTKTEERMVSSVMLVVMQGTTTVDITPE